MLKMSRLLCALCYTFVFVYSHCLLVQVNQYMLACMLSVDVALICRPACFSLFFLLSSLLSFSSVVLTVILFCRPYWGGVLFCRLNCCPVLWS